MNVVEGSRVPIKMWTDGVPVEDQAMQQLVNLSAMPFVYKWIAAMPDVHWGMGATVGSVIATKKAIIPAAVGVDIGCGMMAVKTSLTANDLPDSLHAMRSAIEVSVPHGRTDNGGRNDKGSWQNLPDGLIDFWNKEFADGYKSITDNYPNLNRGTTIGHLGTLGTGNHFIEVCLDLDNNVWIMLHSGSRGVGNRIGSHFIELAKKDMEKYFINVPDKDLAYLPEGTEHFNEYMKAVSWAQKFARENRNWMMGEVQNAVETSIGKNITLAEEFAVNCHHNYVEKESHYGENVWVTRKGAVRARSGDYGIIPGSMGARSFIVKGKGNPESFNSCSHGAGRAMSRNEARKRFTVDDMEAQTEGIECRKDEDVIDEIPSAYKDIQAVMDAQSDLVEIIAELRQVLCVKG